VTVFVCDRVTTLWPTGGRSPDCSGQTFSPIQIKWTNFSLSTSVHVGCLSVHVGCLLLVIGDVQCKSGDAVIK